MGLIYLNSACSLLVSFDDPEKKVQRCDMVPPDCSVEACLERLECAPVECNPEVVYYDSAPACPDDDKCVWVDDAANTGCVPGYLFSEDNFYDRCDQGRCPHGSVCIEGMVGSPDVCVPYCNVFSHARCPDGGTCFPMNESALIDICFREDGCDPVKNTGCPAGEGCYYIPTDTSTCLPAGEKPVGERCKIQWDCAGGHVCTDIVTGEYGKCVKVCRELGDCQPEEICEFIGLYGVCRLAIDPL